MKTWETINGSKITQVLSGRSNAYLITKDNSVILADTGKASAFKILIKNLKSLNITIDDISTVVLTHTHFDHCQSTKQIKEKSNCRVIVSRSATDSIKNGYTKLPDGTFFITKLIAGLGRLTGKHKFGYEPFEPDIFIKDDYEINIGNSKILITETIGHSSDSVSIIVDNEIAIVGDAMFGVSKNSIFPPYSDNVGKMIESWGKLLRTGCNTFLPGHGKEISQHLLKKEYIKYKEVHLP